jgi:hypothetical protein
MFDVVIFDEASQIIPADAISSIMRAHQIVVAGDDRLWSTNWFADPRGEVAKVRDAYQRAVDAAEPTVPDEPGPPVQAPGQSADVVRRI